MLISIRGKVFEYDEKMVFTCDDNDCLRMIVPPQKPIFFPVYDTVTGELKRTLVKCPHCRGDLVLNEAEKVLW